MGFDADEWRLEIARGDGAPELIAPLPSPGGTAKLAFGVESDVVEDEDAVFALVVDERRIPLPRPTEAHVTPPGPSPEEQLEALREELHDVRMQLEAAESRADEAYWNQLAAEERNAKARATAEEHAARAEEHAARADQLAAALNSAREDARAALNSAREEARAALNAAREDAAATLNAAREEAAAALNAAREDARGKIEEVLKSDEVGRLQTELELVQEAAAQMEMELQRSLAELSER